MNYRPSRAEDDRMSDPLLVCSTRPCLPCGGNRRRRKKCEECRGTGFQLTSLENLWAPSAGFLVCGGPSLETLPLETLRERGIVSLGVNNAAAAVPVTAWCFGDTQSKFHHSLFLDPKMMTFAPTGKLRRGLRAKLPDGSFRSIDPERLCHCPSTYGIARSSRFDAETFLTTEYAHWGISGKSAGELGGRRTLSTMLVGIRLMHYLGCRRMYMLGVDFEMKDGRKYGFNEVVSGGRGKFRKYAAMLEELKPVFEAAGFFLLNCNPKSRCEVFPHVPFDEALRDCRGAVPEEPYDLAEWYSHNVAAKMREAHPDPITLQEVAALQNATAMN